MTGAAKLPASAYAYIRHSTKRQGAEDKDSVTRQKSGIRALAVQYGVEIPDEHFFYENGVSAFSGKNRTHGKLKELIDQIDSLRIRSGDYVFVESIDRLTRQRLLQAKDLVNGILDKGIILVTTIDNQRYEKATIANGIDDLTQDILLSVIAKRAFDESHHKSVRRKKAWDSAKLKAEENNVPFNAARPPFGIRYNPETNRFEVHPEEGPEVVRVFESLKLQGVTSTVKEMNKTSSIKWTQNRIKDLFKKKYPIGYLYSQKKVDGAMVFDRMIENYYPQIVSFQLFEEARLSMQKRKIDRRVGRVSAHNANILRHVAVCAHCNESLFFMNHYSAASGNLYYLNCRNNFETTGKCGNRFRYDLAIKALFDIIKEADLMSDFKERDEVIKLHPRKREQLEKRFSEHWSKYHKEEFLLKNPAIESGSYEEIQGAIRLIERGIRLFVEFNKIMKGNAKDVVKSKRLYEIEDEILKNQNRLESYNRSIQAWDTDFGDLPPALLQNFGAAKKTISLLREEREKLTVDKLSQPLEQIATLKEFIELFRTNNGRLRIINFLNQSGLTFKFAFDKKAKVMRTTVYKEISGPFDSEGRNSNVISEPRHRDRLRYTDVVWREELATTVTPYEPKRVMLEEYGFVNLGDELLAEKEASR